jgi:hypothetical protein
LFPFYDLQGGFRKEIIVFTSFALLSWSYAQKRLSFQALMAALGIYTIGVFAHELTIFALPYFLYILMLGLRKSLISKRASAYFSATFITTSLIGILFSSVFNGNTDAVAQICSSLTERRINENICTGAIEWLNKDARYGFDVVISIAPQYATLYPLLFLLSFLPALLTDWVKRETIALTLIGLFWMAPLYLFAVDWGRWIHIQIFLTFCLILAEDVVFKVQPSKFLYAICFLYLSTWSLPHCCTNSIHTNLILRGYVDTAKFYKIIIAPKFPGLTDK